MSRRAFSRLAVLLMGITMLSSHVGAVAQLAVQFPLLLSHPGYDSASLGTTATLAGLECEFHVNWTTSLGNMDYFVFGTNASGGGWQNSTHSFSSGTWSNQTLTLPAEHGVQVIWQTWANNTAGNWNTTGPQTLHTTWNSSRTIGWVFDRVVDRLVNATFPLVKEWDERYNQTTGLCDPELLVGVTAYNFAKNETYLDFAEEYANWLMEQPICRLFQRYNLTSESWQPKVSQERAGKMLSLLAQLAIYNSTYEPLLHEALQNFTNIFVPPNTNRGYDLRYTDGSPVRNKWGVRLEYTSIQAFAYSITGVAYSGYALFNNSWIQKGVDMLLNYSLGTAGLPYHQIDQAGNWWGGILSKQDASIGMYLLAAETVYALSENASVKERIKTVAESTIEHTWVEDRSLFRYQTDPDTGNPPLGGGQMSVHGFGALDEGLLQASLIWNNETWRACGARDYSTLVVDEHILVNNLVSHAVTWNDTSYWVDSALHYDSDVYWNSFSHRAGYVFYATNATGFYHNRTFLDSYKKLYDAQNAHHKASKGFVRGLNVSNFRLVSPSYPNYLRSYDNYTPLYTSWKCFVPSNLESLALNDAADIITFLGIPLTGVRMRSWNILPTQPTVDITPDSAFTLDNLTCTVTVPSIDPEGEIVTYFFEWFRDQGSGYQLIPSLTEVTTELSVVLHFSNTRKDEVWKCIVTPNDGTDNGTSGEDEVAILNSPPTILSHYPLSNPTIFEGGNQEFNITKFDADNDPLMVVWWVNQSVTGETADFFIFTADFWSAGTYNVTVFIADGVSHVTQEWWLEVVDLERDAAIINLDPCKTVVGEGHPAYINITVANQGELTETLNFTIFGNVTIIISFVEVTLAGGETTTITITWNTSSFSKGVYIVGADTPILQGEIDTADNTFADGAVVVTIPGDVDADYDVDIYDIVIVADAYDTQIGDSRFVANGDIDGDWDIDIYDVVIAADNYGQSWQP